MAKSLKIRKILRDRLKTSYTDADVSIIFDDKNSVYVTDNSGKPVKVSDILEFENESSKPSFIANKLFYAKDTKKIFYCTGSEFIEIGGSGGGGGTSTGGADYWGKDLVVGGAYTGTWDFGKIVLTRRDKSSYSSGGSNDVVILNEERGMSGMTKKDCSFEGDSLGFFLNGSYRPSGNGSQITWKSQLSLGSGAITLEHSHRNQFGSYYGEGKCTFTGENFSMYPSEGIFKNYTSGFRVMPNNFTYDPIFFVGTNKTVPEISTKEVLNINADKGVYINGKKYPEASSEFTLKELVYGTNPDNITQSGFYFGKAFVGAPYGDNVTCVLESFNINSAWIIQRLQALGAGEIYTRSKKDGKWDPWQLVIARLL